MEDRDYFSLGPEDRTRGLNSPLFEITPGSRTELLKRLEVIEDQVSGLQPPRLAYRNAEWNRLELLEYLY
jgi:hypothetical protein